MNDKLREINSINIGINASNMLHLQMILDSKELSEKLKTNIATVLQRTKLIQENLREEEEIVFK